MKAEDIIVQLGEKLPQLVDDFSTNIPVSSIVPSGSDALVTTTIDHGLTPGDVTIIEGAESPIAILTLTRNGIIGSAEFSEDHDYTFNTGSDLTKNIIIDGATESEFNGTFQLLSVPNRRNVTFQMTDSGSTVATGSPLGLNSGSFFQSYNGTFEVLTAPTTTTFTYTPLEPKTLDASGTILVKHSIRVSGALTMERALDSYTAQGTDDLWLFVVLDDVNANRNRNIVSDAVDNLQRSQQGDGFRQQTIQSVTLYAFISTSGSIGGRAAGDKAQELFIPICQSILFSRFDSLYAEGPENPLQFTSHGFVAYNTAAYIHRYSFEMSADLTFADTVGFDPDVAFRDISLTIDLDTGSEPITSSINLDEEPLT